MTRFESLKIYQEIVDFIGTARNEREVFLNTMHKCRQNKRKAMEVFSEMSKKAFMLEYNELGQSFQGYAEELKHTLCFRSR